MSSATPAASAEATMEATAGHSEPVGIVAHYTATGATVFWKTPMEVSGLSNFNIELRSNGGTWKALSTVPASQMSIDITKGDTTGWTSVRVSSVYSDGQIVSGKVFGLPGQFA